METRSEMAQRGKGKVEEEIITTRNLRTLDRGMQGMSSSSISLGRLIVSVQVRCYKAK